MDLLKSLQMEDDLPEQQTRTSHLISSKGGDDTSENNFDLKLGFDVCCYCGKNLKSNNAVKKKKKVQCNNCQRVFYCSNECKEKDSKIDPTTTEDENDNDEPTALGHTSIVCALLALMNDDEALEQEQDIESPSSSDISNNGVQKKKKDKKKKNSSSLSSSTKLEPKRREAAIDRITSEYESYPATLANILMEGPCYQTTLRNCGGVNDEKGNNISQHKKRKTTTTLKPGGGNLTIHIIGASNDSELWIGHPSMKEQQNVFRNYADALSEISDTYQLQTINLVFIGPGCPTKNMEGTVPLISSIMASTAASSSSSLSSKNCNNELKFQTIQGPYNKKTLSRHCISTPQPDIVVFFNPGFTCPDYDWREALLTIQAGTPCLITTNTELEGVADAQYLFDNDFIQQLPPSLVGIMMMDDEDDNYGDGGYDDNDDDNNMNNNEAAFFSLNPYCGMRVRQSGTMANDLYVKNRWIFGGICGSNKNNTTINNSTATANSSNGGSGGCEHTGPTPSRRKKSKIDGSGNTKKKNPALV